MFLTALLQSQIVISTLIRSDVVPSILSSNAGCLRGVLDAIAGSEKVTMREEGAFIGQIERRAPRLIARFLEEGLALGHICEFEGGEAVSGGRGGGAYAVLYRALLMVCSRGGAVSVPVLRVGRVNRYTLYYLRLLSYSQTELSPAQLQHILGLFFESRRCTHLHISVFRILARAQAAALEAAGFFMRLREQCHVYAARWETMQDVEPIFWFLVKLYMLFQSHMASEHGEWRDLDGLMQRHVAQERMKYGQFDGKAAEEYEGFERYVISRMLDGMPYPSIFEEDKGFVMM